MPATSPEKRKQAKTSWSCSPLVLGTAILGLCLGFLVIQSFLTKHVDPNGCNMAYMWPAFYKFTDFDAGQNRFASKYSLYLYREGGIDEDIRVKGIPILFVPGNAGRYSQARSLAAEAARHFDGVVKDDVEAINSGKRPFDFFAVDFNEEFTAFDGQTLLDQAEFVNDAIALILSLYENPQRALRDSTLPNPSSVIIVGHSMGGIVARASLLLPNTRHKSINTILTLAAPHARAPVSFDGKMVQLYRHINSYWRNAYAQELEQHNPLNDVTLISIAGGGADTTVPSDYATTSAFLPATHGFTVFTSTIPHTWAGMDHLAITWCDQLRKSVIRALFDVVDARLSTQTVAVSARMRSFKKWLLTGLEEVAENSASHTHSQTLLILPDEPLSTPPRTNRLVLRQLGSAGAIKAHMLPLSPTASLGNQRFTLLTNQQVQGSKSDTSLEVLLCSTFPRNPEQSDGDLPVLFNLSDGASTATRFACKDASPDIIALPASTHDTQFPFTKHPSNNPPPFSYLQYDLSSLSEYQFVAVVDKQTQQTPGWLIAETTPRADSIIESALSSLLFSAFEASNAAAGMNIELRISSAFSSLLAYKIRIKPGCSDTRALFTPLAREHISDPYESKFFVNVTEADVSIHGIAPYVARPLHASQDSQGVAFQVWSDPTCNAATHVSLRLDLLGSLGKLWMRYRTVFAAFPILIVAIVFSKQLEIHDNSGIFIGFSASLDLCLRRTLPTFLAILTSLGFVVAKTTQAYIHPSTSPPPTSQAPFAEHLFHFIKSDLLLDAQDEYFWLLVPLFALITIGVCLLFNHLVLILTHSFAFLIAKLRRRNDESESVSYASEHGRNPVTVGMFVLGLFVIVGSTALPYQLLFVVLCLIQWSTCVRAVVVERKDNSASTANLSNYAHSVLLLMLWILPINGPVLVVLVKNFAVGWITPVSTYHNLISIVPFALHVEQLTKLRPVPRLTSWRRHIATLLFYFAAIFTAFYGVIYAYLLHYIVNVIFGWLSLTHTLTVRRSRSLGPATREGHSSSKTNRGRS